MFSKKIQFSVLFLILLFAIGIFVLRYMERNDYFDATGCRPVIAREEYAKAIQASEENRDVIYLDEDGVFCEENWFNCSDFCIQEDAQKVLDDCYGDTEDHDVHFLDEDGDGIACERLP